MSFAFEFIPKPRSNLQLILDRTAFASPAMREAALKLKAIFFEGISSPCHQTSWMGRGCFSYIQSSSQSKYSYLATKGVGPGPGSELIRQRLDQVFQNRHNCYAGCLRLETGSYYPLLVCFRLRDGQWLISNPRPEGFSGFRNLLREFVVTTLIERTSIPILLPLLLFRDFLPTPWIKETQEGLEEYIFPKMPSAICQYLASRNVELPSANNFPVSKRLYNASYFNLDGGTMIRAAMSPYRVANLHEAAVKEDGECLKLLREHFTKIHSKGLKSESHEFTISILRFIHVMANMAADLFSEGIVHGQLHLHYQNITLAGEIADFDCGIFTMPILQKLGIVNYSTSISLQEYEVFWKELIRLSQHLGADVLSILYADYDYIGGISPTKWDKYLLASSMLQQIYDIYNHAFRTIDLLSRVGSLSIHFPGTVLAVEEWQTLSFSFKDTFKKRLLSRHSYSLYDWCLKYGYEYLIEENFNYMGRQTIYGWSFPDAPLNYSCAVCTEHQQQHIHEQVRLFFD